MSVFQGSLAARAPADELQANGGQCSRVSGLPTARWPNATAWYCNDTGTAPSSVGNLYYDVVPAAGSRLYAIGFFEIVTAMPASKSWRLLGWQSGGSSVGSAIRIVTDGSANHRLEIVDGANLNLATGTTVLSTSATRSIMLVMCDDTGSGRIMTVWLWNGTAWAQECTHTALVTGGQNRVSGFGIDRGKGNPGSGGVFEVGNFYVTDNTGTRENGMPADPRYLLEMNPNGNGTYGDFDAGAPSYLDVDESPANDGDTTYDGSGTVNALKQQTYAMTDPTIPAGSSPFAV